MPAATNLRDGFNKFDPSQPLFITAQDKEYYVERPSSGVDLLIEYLQDDDRQATKILFSGHRGSGKSTELRRLSQALFDQYFVVYFDADDVLDVADIDYRDVLVTLGIKLYQMAQQRSLDLEAKFKDQLLNWYRTTLNEVAFDTSASDEGEVKLDGYVMRLAGKLKAEAHTRKVIRTQIESRLSDLILRINDLCKTIQDKCDKPVLCVIDGLDRIMKLDEALKLFHQNTALINPTCKIIYTVPLALYYTKEMGQVRVTFDKDFLLPNLKPYTRAGDANPDELDLLSNIIARRLDASLITPAAVRRLSELSGGLVRELISLTKEAIAHARSQRVSKVDTAQVEKAANAIRNRYRGMLTQADRAELLQCHADKQLLKSDLRMSLLHSLALLEYTNDESWCDVNPLLWALLDEWRAERK